MDKLKRREFFKLSLTGAAAIAGCTRESGRKLLPYIIPPEDIIPGVPVWYASTCVECPAGCGILVKTLDARVIKIEGNPAHPVNKGGLCAMGQASLQGLYNPDRIKTPLAKNPDHTFKEITWEQAEEVFVNQLRASMKNSKGRIAFVSSATGGSFEKLVRKWMGILGSEKFFIFETFDYAPLKEACMLTFGEKNIPEYKIYNADFLLSFGADFLETWLNPVGFTKEFASRRTEEHNPGFIYAGPRRSLTAANADEWIPVSPGDELYIALGVLHSITHDNLYKREFTDTAKKLKNQLKDFSPEAVSQMTGVPATRIRGIAKAFTSNESSLALGPGNYTGNENARATGIAVHLLNYIAGNFGKTVSFVKDNKIHPDNYNIAKLLDDINKNSIDILIIKDANPVFHLSRSSGFKEALKSVPYIISFSRFIDETTQHAGLVMPDHHPLETWADRWGSNGVYSLVQPAMRQVFDTKHTGDVLLSTAQRLNHGLISTNFYDFLRDEWKGLKDKFEPSGDFDEFWKTSLMKGFFAVKIKEQPPVINPQVFKFRFQRKQDAGEKIIVYPSTLLFDGRGANKPYLLETPDPVTKIVWGNWAEIHPSTAKRLGLKKGNTILIQKDDESIELPVFITDGVHKDCVAVPAGYGHKNYGRYADGTGVNPFEITQDLNRGTQIKIMKGAGDEEVVCLQGSFSQHGRGIVKVIYEGEHDMVEPKEAHKPVVIYPMHKHTGHRWGMVIDLNKCTGCSACVVACYAENNIAVVGKKQAAEGREMSWIRIESYVEGKFFLSIPMLCQHCDNGPCEPVCPVYATYHNPEGLNVQVYNRCVGTRYCSHNCPYKVRRFNFFDYPVAKPLEMQFNPDVSVREKGVMEKCSFCLQRIIAAKDRAKDENRTVKDGEIQPACAHSCPADAIVFGDLNDQNSMVSKLKKSKRSYRVFEQLNTEPAITYLKRIIRRKA